MLVTGPRVGHPHLLPEPTTGPVAIGYASHFGWNFSHIVNFRRILAYSAVNLHEAIRSWKQERPGRWRNMARNENRFDAVRMMRTIRNELDERMRGMTFDEEQAYIQQRLRSPSTDPDSRAATGRPSPDGPGAGRDR